MDELKFGDPRLPERFWKRHTVDSQGCWVWNSDKGISSRDGRASIWANGKSRPNYAATCDIAKGPLPLGLTRSHICPGGANPLCANPQHIVIESLADNHARDRTYSFEYPPSGINRGDYLREYLRKYRAENKAKRNEYQREYRAKNKAKK